MLSASGGAFMIQSQQSAITTALKKLNTAIAKSGFNSSRLLSGVMDAYEAFELQQHDFNQEGQAALIKNSASNAAQIAQALLKIHQPGKWGGIGYFTGIHGNNHKAWGAGQPERYKDIVRALQTIQHTPHDDQHTDLTVPHTTAPVLVEPQPAGAGSALTVHTDLISNGLNSRIPAAIHGLPGDASTPAQPTSPPHSGRINDELEAAPLHQDNPHDTDAATHSVQTAPPAPPAQKAPDPEIQDSTTATLVDQSSDIPDTKQEHIPSQKPPRKMHRPAVAAGTLATAGGLAWLLTLLAHTESRKDIQLFWRKLFSKKTRAQLREQKPRIREQIRKHGAESIGAILTSLAGLGLITWGSTRRSAPEQNTDKQTN